MKSLLGLFVLCSFISITANAEEAKPGLEQAKQNASANIDARTASLEKMKTCMQSATDKEAMKACRQAHQTEMASVRAEHKEKRRAKLDEKMKKIQARKAKMDAESATK